MSGKPHLATTITRDHKHICQCKSILSPYYRGKLFTFTYKKSSVSEWQITFGYIRSTKPAQLLVFIIKGKEFKAGCASFITNSPPFTSSLYSYYVYKILGWSMDFRAWFYCCSSSQDGASTPGVFNLIWNSLSVCSSCFWFPAKYAAMALWNRTSWLCKTLTCKQERIKLKMKRHVQNNEDWMPVHSSCSYADPTLYMI